MDAPPLRPDEALVAVEGAVLGGPEVRAVALSTGLSPGGAAVGIVVASGDAAADLLGRRVLVPPTGACGECDVCRRGRLAACPTGKTLGRDVHGTLASHVVGRRRWLLPLDGPLAALTLGPEAAALAREAALAYALFARAGVGPGDVTVWLGDGPIARLGAGLARARGHGVAVDEPAEPVFKVFETSGSAKGRRRALALAARGGMGVLLAGSAVGVPDDEPLPLGAALEGEITLLSVAMAHPDLLPEVAALAARGELDVAAVCADPTSDLDAALTAARHDPAGPIRIVQPR